MTQKFISIYLLILFNWGDGGYWKAKGYANGGVGICMHDVAAADSHAKGTLHFLKMNYYGSLEVGSPQGFLRAQNPK